MKNFLIILYIIGVGVVVGLIYSNITTKPTTSCKEVIAIYNSDETKMKSSDYELPCINDKEYTILVYKYNDAKQILDSCNTCKIVYRDCLKYSKITYHKIQIKNE